MALESMRHARASDEVRDLIEARLKAQSDWATQVEAARLQGLEQATQHLARRMRAEGFDEETIRRNTGL